MELSEIVMKQLRDQDDYIKNTENGLQDNYQKFNNLLKQSMTITTKDGESFAISTANRFEESLRNAGRKELSYCFDYDKLVEQYDINLIPEETIPDEQTA